MDMKYDDLSTTDSAAVDLILELSHRLCKVFKDDSTDEEKIQYYNQIIENLEQEFPKAKEYVDQNWGCKKKTIIDIHQSI